MATQPMDAPSQSTAGTTKSVRADLQSGFRLLRAGGVETRVDWSLAIIFLLITFSLGAGLFPAWHPDWAPWLWWATALAAAVLFFVSLWLHELSHALVGRALGVPINRITLFLFGGMAHMEAEPKGAGADFLMAIAGPITSLIVGMLAIIVGTSLAGISSEQMIDVEVAYRQMGPLATLLLWLGPINIVLAIFNLLPGFPLDGGRVLRAILWGITGDLSKATRWASGVGRALALGLIFLGILMMFGAFVPWLGGGFVTGLWLVLIGWFLNIAAMRAWQYTVATDVFRGMPVSRLMRAPTAAVDADTSLDTVADRLLEEPGEQCVPVMDRQRGVVGMVCVTDLRKARRSDWDHRTAGEVMTPLESLPVLRSDEDLADALGKLGGRDVDMVPVVEDGAVRGVLRLSDLMRWLEIQSPRPA